MTKLINTTSNLTKKIPNVNITPFQPQDITKNHVKNLLSKGRDYDMFYYGYRVNHSAHIYYSLYALGATPKICDNYLDFSKTFLEPAKVPTQLIDLNNWSSFIGQRHLYSSYLLFFDQEVKSKGWLQCFKFFLPNLITGLCGSALHPLIHLGYAVEFQDSIIASEALAFAASYYSPIGDFINQLVPSPSPISALEAMTLPLKSIDPIDLSSYNTLGDRLNQVVPYYESYYLDACTKWGCTPNNLVSKLSELTLTIANIFNGTYRRHKLDFFLFHALTANHAVHQLLPHLSPIDQSRLVNINFFALCLLYTTQSRPDFQDPISYFNSESELNPEYQWEFLVTEACNNIDSHVVKGVRYCHDIELKYGFHGGLFRTIAYRLVKDILSNEWCFRGIGQLSKDES